MFENSTVLNLYAAARMSEADRAERSYVQHLELEQAPPEQTRRGNWHLLKHMLVIPHKHMAVRAG